MSRLIAATALMLALMSPAGAVTTVPPPGAPMSLLQPAQGYACRACRQDCHARYRVYCGYSERCRRAFTLCMRDCWYGYCR